MKQEQISEWAEGAVTIELRSLVAKQLEMIRFSKGESYHPGDPQKTQETLCTLLAAEGAWEDINLMLTGDWDYFVEEENEEEG